MEDKPVLISCLMPTYNKLPRSKHLVEEAIESFLRQEPCEDASVKYELIICNDAPRQKLAFDHPAVRIFNCAERFPSLGDKLNWMTAQADGDVLCRWDDDDINLPWGLKWRYERLVSHEAQFICPKRFWATNGAKTTFEYGSYAQCMYLREIHDSLGGYAGKSFAEDLDFENRARDSGYKLLLPAIVMDETFYFYRWGTGSEHLSGFGRNGHGWMKIGVMPVVEGTYQLKPHWREDYVLRARRTMEARRAANKKD